jgi:predicted MPP superfamily phosphohydrolase
MREESIVRIAHLSDLHFGAHEKFDAWDSLADHLATVEQPKLILVTGDIVDSPKKSWFSLAKQRLDDLAKRVDAKYFVCPGNHDTYWRGNRLPGKKPAELFYAEFRDHFVTAERPETMWLGQSPHRWNIRLAGIDTSENARWSAKAFLSLRDRDRLKKLKDITEAEDQEPPHLVMVLLHHHLLPIRALEGDKQKLSQLFDFTAATNPAAIMETLASSYVDIALHGHEHARNCARYGSYAASAGPLAIVGAGSATGMETSKGWDVKRASFNILELRKNRSVYLREVRGPGAVAGDESWSTDAQATLLQTTEVRYNRFLRSLHRYRTDHPKPSQPIRVAVDQLASRTDFASSELQKHVTITATRDALVRDRRTSRLIKNGRFCIPLKNLSGQPITGNLPARIQLMDGRPLHLAASLLSIGNEPGAFELAVKIPNEDGEVLAESIELDYRWLDALILTKADFHLLTAHQLGEIRWEGLEFVAATVPDPVGSLTLSVTFPIGYAPTIEKFQVLHQRVKSGPREIDGFLTSRLQHTGTTVMLFVHYPLQGTQYAIAWEPVDTPEVEPHVKRFWDAAASGSIGFTMAKACLNGLAGHAWGTCASVAIYVPQFNSNCIVLRLIGFAAGDDALHARQPEETLPLKNTRGLYKHAWWDEPDNCAIAAADQKDETQALIDEGFLEGENILTVMPVKGIGGLQRYPHALVRIARLGPHDATHNLSALRASLAASQLAMVNILNDLEFLT